MRLSSSVFAFELDRDRDVCLAVFPSDFSFKMAKDFYFDLASSVLNTKGEMPPGAVK